ncbi:MAG: ABC transporter ATP-binding protein [Spirochaetales bacterium]|nr:ABC transporter ATP-binding protein [Spirochaetales bacterium]
MEITIKDVSKNYGQLIALSSVSFSVRQNELLSIIGPSGSGKTTLLKVLAEIEKPSNGIVYYPENLSGRKILVFQEYLLFPHMTIYENVVFGLKAAKMDKQYIKRQVLEYLDIFKIGDKRNSYPGELSGGQKQRAVIARAMVLEPSLLLLDEPFANLDKRLKMETAVFIKDIQQKLKTTIVCVTHDLDEAYTISDRLGILIDGKLLQISKPEDLFINPVSEATAEFFGSINQIPANLFPALNLSVEDDPSDIFIRPEAFRMERVKGGEGVVLDYSYTLGAVEYLIDYKGTPIRVKTLDADFEKGELVELNLSSRFLSSRKGWKEEKEAL